MASSHAARQWLEAFKFSVYIITPIAATVYFGTGAYPYLERMIHHVSDTFPPPFALALEVTISCFSCINQKQSLT